jgi:hypothetical protein
MSLATQPTNPNFLSALNFRFLLKRAPLVNFFTIDATIPTVELGVARQPTPFVTIPRPDAKITFGTFNISFRVDEDMKNYAELYDWMSALGEREGFDAYKNKISNQTNSTGTGPTSDCTLMILNSSKKPNVEIVFRDAFPTNLSQIDFSVEYTDVRYATCRAEFTFRDFTVTKL